MILMTFSIQILQERVWVLVLSTHGDFVIFMQEWTNYDM